MEKDNLHISLKFLGNLNDAQIEKVVTLLQKVAAESQYFPMTLNKNIGSFPNFIRPRVIWAGIEKGSNRISQLYFSIEKIMKPEVFYRSENRFTAHITLARIKYIGCPKRLKGFIDNITIQNITQKVKKIELMESQLGKEGPKYHVISSFSFAP